MPLREPRKRPDPWKTYAGRYRPRWTLGFHALEWGLQWTAYYLSRWAFLEVLEYLGVFSVLIAVIFYFSESGDRLKQKHYQAWQVINTAQGKGGSGGRIEALQELNADGVPLVGVDLSGAFLQGIYLRGARLVRSNFASADLRDSDFSTADFADADLRSANFRQCNLRNASFQRANLEDADLAGADLSGADLSAANFAGADLRNANLANLRWRDAQNLKGANIFGVKNAPEGFVSWAVKHGAVQFESEPQ